MASMRQLIVGVVAALLACVATPALAQFASSARAAPGIQVEMFDVEQVPQLTSGTQFNFSLFGTPGAKTSAKSASPRPAAKPAARSAVKPAVKPTAKKSAPRR